MFGVMPERVVLDSAQTNPAGELGQLQRMFELAPGFAALVEGDDHRFVMANAAFGELVGRRELVGRTLAEALPELASQAFTALLDAAAISGGALVEPRMSMRVTRSDDMAEELFVNIVFQPLAGAAGKPADVFVQGHEVTGDQRNETIRAAHNRVLELAIGDSSLERTLGELIGIVEATSSTGVLGSILLLDADGKHLRHGAAPSLPADYMAAIDGAEIGPVAGSCGTAAYRREPVFVTDIATDPLWAVYKAVALPHGLQSCWSTPIMTRGGQVLGTFAMYHHEPREPTVRDLTLVDLVTQTAALVIDRERAQEALRKVANTA
ncbi:MAG: GAF domain-containing protein [Sphingomicrobium sp.]